MNLTKNMEPKKMDSKKLQYIFKKVLKKIKEKPDGFFEFKKLRGVRGLWYWGEKIEIDYRKEIVPTIIHEMLHDLYPDNNENWIRQVESKISQILQPYDIFLLMSNTFSKLNLEKTKKTK